MQYPTVRLPGGRSARLVPGDAAGEFMLVLTEPSLAERLRALGCDESEIDAAEYLEAAWQQCGAVPAGQTNFEFVGSSEGAGWGFEERLQSGPWQRYSSAMAVMGQDAQLVRGFVIDAAPITASDVQRLRDALGRLARSLRR